MNSENATVTLDDKLIAREHAISLLKRARAIAAALERYDAAPRGRGKETAIIRMIAEARCIKELLERLELGGPMNRDADKRFKDRSP